MFRWIRNIFAAIVIGNVIFWILMMTVTGDFSELPVPDSDTVVILVIATMSTCVLWLTGLTGQGTAKIRQRSTIILTYVEQAVRMNLPLPRMLLAAEASEPRWIADRITRLRKKLEAGSSIADALEKTVPGLSRRDIAMITTAERVGRMGPQLTHLVRHEQTIQTRNLAERSFLRSYPTAMICVIIAILSMVMIFVIPKYEQIFRDFKTPLPPITEAVIELCDYPTAVFFVLISAAIALLATIADGLCRRVDWFEPSRWFTSNRDLADICHVIAESMEAGQPLTTAIRGATDLSINTGMQIKLNRWANGIENGQSTADSAIAAGMPKLIAGLTTSADGFAFLSRYYHDKFSRTALLIRAAAVPAMVLFFGVIVAIVALTLFLPIIALIDSVGSVKTPFESWL
jgi:type IV pilus assembly protein PilC